MTDTILITGASGQLAQRVVHHLLASENVEPARIVTTTRKPAAVAGLAARGISIRHADFEDASSLDRAFEGADSILVISTDLIDLVNGARLRQHETAVAAARTAGAKHVSYTSMLHPEPGSPMPFANDHYGTEQAIKATGISYSIFQNNAYFENLFMVLPTAIKSGRWLSSAGAARTAYVARDDIAAAIASRLASGPRDSRTFAFTGPDAFTNAEVAKIASEVSGRPIEMIDLPGDALKKQLLDLGIPEEFAMLNVAVDANARAGKADLVNETIRALTRRDPMSLPAFLSANQARLIE